MRFLFLALALPLAACGAFDCPSIGPYETVEATQRLRATPEVSDTLTVLIEPGYTYIEDIYVALGANVPRPSVAGETELLVSVEYSNYEAAPERVPRLQVDARADTLVVSIPEGYATAATPTCARGDGLVQPVCSYAPATFTLFLRGVVAPDKFRVVQYLVRDEQGRLAPMTPISPSASSRGTRASRSVRA